MLMVVFGAGASYDSFYSLPPELGHEDSRIPLAKDLFSDRAEFTSVAQTYKQCQPILSRLRHVELKT